MNLAPLNVARLKHPFEDPRIANIALAAGAVRLIGKNVEWLS